MEWEGFDISVDEGSLLVEDDGFSLGIDSEQSVDIQLLTGMGEGKGEVTVGLGECDVEGDFEPLSPGEIVDIFGVMIKGLEGDELSYWFKMGETRFYFSSRPGDDKDVKWLESKIDIAFLKADEDSIMEAVKIKPRVVVPYGGSEPEIREFAAELEDRSFDVERP
jgi:hypothetical protein